jgi:branched-chain amino acid transport system ATP-binding protein
MIAEILQVSGLHAYYGESHILHGVDFSVQSGEVVTLLGRNGAGRTTTLKALLGLVGKRSGSVRINGHARRSAAFTPACRPRRTCYCPR